MITCVPVEDLLTYAWISALSSNIAVVFYLIVFSVPVRKRPLLHLPFDLYSKGKQDPQRLTRPLYQSYFDGPAHLFT